MVSSSSPENIEEKAKAFEKALYAELDERIKTVHATIEKEGSLVPRIRKVDFYILVGSMLLWLWWYAAAVGNVGSYMFSLCITIPLLLGTLAVWRILNKPISYKEAK